jgi:hypothetical protein
MKHAEKVKLARKMSRTARDDEAPRAGLFDTEAWDRRRAGRRERVKRHQAAAHERAVARRAAK